MHGEKQKAAFTSVIAAVFLTAVKVVVGIFTGSLGILSEAAHSILDLCAAVVTFFAVRFSDKPADKEHTYGHGKIESFSALLETLLLLATCAWIIYEAVKRIVLGKTLEVSGTAWGVGIMLLSIVINLSRARVLKKTAKKYGSQALEADALHFDSDVWSSLVVIGGLICVALGDYFKITFLHYGDPLAALGVSVLVIVVSIKLGKRTVDVLLDTAPKGMVSDILRLVNSVQGVLDVDNVRVRPSGTDYFIDLNVGINRNESHRVVHSIIHEIREKLRNEIPNSDIVVGTYPVDIGGVEDMEVYHAVKKVVDRFPVCTNIHNIHVYEVSGGKYISIHLEVKEDMNVKSSHDLSHEIDKLIKSDIKDVRDVNVYIECAKLSYIQAEDVTGQSQGLVEEIERLINKVPEKLNCHDIKVYEQGSKKTIFLHCELNGNYTTEKVDRISKNIISKIKRNIKDIESIHIHVEPIGE